MSSRFQQTHITRRAHTEITGERAGLGRYLSLDNDHRFALESVDAFDDAVGRAAALGFTDVVVHWPRAQGVYAGSEAVLERMASELDGLRALGR